jgi:hypothetical protein
MAGASGVYTVVSDISFGNRGDGSLFSIALRQGSADLEIGRMRYAIAAVFAVIAIAISPFNPTLHTVTIQSIAPYSPAASVGLASA